MKCRRHFFTIWDSGVKRSALQCCLADCTKNGAAKLVLLLVVRSIPMSLLRRKSCSALASTIFESPLHRTKATCTIFFCSICQVALQDRPFVTWIRIGKIHLETGRNILIRMVNSNGFIGRTDNLAVVGQFFHTVCTPAGNTCHCKNRCI